MPEGPLFAADEGDSSSGGGGDGNDYAYGDDSGNQKGAGGDSDDSGDDDDSASDAAAASKSEFADSDPPIIEICRPGEKKTAEKKTKCTADVVKKNLDACDGGTKAWDNAKTAAGKEPTVKFEKFEGKAAAQTLGSDITIRPTSNCCDATESLLFELHNVESKPTFDKIFKDANDGLTAREDFARAIERVEYEGLKRSWETFDTCKKKWGCGSGAKSFADGAKAAKNFDDFYDKFEADWHKDDYRKAWDKYYKTSYDAKHKKGP